MNDIIKQTLMQQMQEAATKLGQQKDVSHFESSGSFSSKTQGTNIHGTLS